MSKTSIEWTDVTWNPTRGCSRVSAGCDHCYAMREARRHDHEGGAYEGLTRVGSRGVDWNGKVRLVPEMLNEPLRWRKPQKVFVNSMSDLFHESLPFEHIAAVYGAMAAASHHTFQVLTKRPRRRIDFHAWLKANVVPEVALCAYHFGRCGGIRPLPRDLELRFPDNTMWPLPNVWEGTSVEDQATADERIERLLQAPAAVRFISLEPQLAHVDLRAYLKGSDAPPHYEAVYGAMSTGGQWLDWVIVGGERGPGAREFYPAWARSVVAQCKPAGVPVFVKQYGSKPIERCPECYGSGESKAANTSGTCPECRGDGIVTLHLRDRKGGDPSEWPKRSQGPRVPEGGRMIADYLALPEVRFLVAHWRAIGLVFAAYFVLVVVIRRVRR